MTQLPPSNPEVLPEERDLLRKLLGLYEEERQLYAKVLRLSRQQGDTVKRGGSMAEVRRILEQKKECLDLIGRLELTEHRAKVDWEKGRRTWSVRGRRRLHETIQEVTELIEEIIICEEKNDFILIEQTRVV